MEKSILLFAHILGTVVWVGGMFFAHMALRPAAMETTGAPVRLQLWRNTLKRFFIWVWVSIVLILLTGIRLYMMYPVTPLYIHIMLGLGVLMMLIFGHIYFGPFRRLKQGVDKQDWETSAAKLNQVRLLVTLNLVLGLTTIAVATLGRYFL